MSTQRRQPITYAEVQEVKRTGKLPLMTDPVKPGSTPYCYTCAYWRPRGKDPRRAPCVNKLAKEEHWTAKLEFPGKPGRMTTGALASCDHHQPK